MSTQFEYGPKGPDGQYQRHPTNVPSDRKFVRPVRRSYKHDKCGRVTRMGLAIAETYAADPTFYGSTFCCGCGRYFPVGANGEFVWMNEDGTATDERVGT